MVGKKRTYTREFKLDAIRLVKDSGKLLREVAADLGIDRSVLGDWVRRYDEAGELAFPGKGKAGPEISELRDLKRRLAIAEEERDILKKALAYFAKERK